MPTIRKKVMEEPGPELDFERGLCLHRADQPPWSFFVQFLKFEF